MGFLQASRKFLRASQVLLPKNESGVFILAYHLAGGRTETPVDIPLEAFRSQMCFLKEKVCSLEDAITRLEDGRADHETRVVITFDDAYENFYASVWPILQQFNTPATLYIPVDFVDGKARAPIRGGESLQPCSWTQIKEMMKDGLLSIGSHSCSHADLRKIDSHAVTAELSQSRKKIEDRLGVAVDSFAYPKALWSRRLEQLVRESYTSAVIRGGMKLQPAKWNRYRLSRLPVRRDMPADLSDILSSPMWLEERMASWIRPWLPDLRNEY